MLLTERAATFVRNVEAYKKKRDLAGEAAKFTTRAKQLKGPTQRLVGLQALAIEMTRAGISVEPPVAALAAAARQASELQLQFENDKKAMAEPDGQFAHQFIPGLSKTAADYLRSIQYGWRRHTEALLIPLPSAVLQALETLPAYKTQVALIRAKHLEAENLVRDVPQPEDVESILRRLKKLLSENQQAWQELGGSGIPGDVLSFLRESGAAGFSLASLTPPILEWLKGRGLLSSFVVRVH